MREGGEESVCERRGGHRGGDHESFHHPRGRVRTKGLLGDFQLSSHTTTRQSWTLALPLPHLWDSSPMQYFLYHV